MPKKKFVSESEFLSVITCSRYRSLHYNPYSLDRSQKIALVALKIFYSNLKKLQEGLSVDNLINVSVVRSIGRKLNLELDAYKKSIELYSYTFIYDFIKRFPPDSWEPVLVDTKIPYELSKYIINFNYDFVFKNTESNTLQVVTFIHKMDKQIETNLSFFEAKASYFHEKVYLPLNKPKINFLYFYLPRYKHSALKKRDTFLFIDIALNLEVHIKPYIDIFDSKILIEKNPFCLNYSCKVRKACYGNQ